MPTTHWEDISELAASNFSLSRRLLDLVRGPARCSGKAEPLGAEAAGEPSDDGPSLKPEAFRYRKDFTSLCACCTISLRLRSLSRCSLMVGESRSNSTGFLAGVWVPLEHRSGEASEITGSKGLSSRPSSGRPRLVLFGSLAGRAEA